MAVLEWHRPLHERADLGVELDNVQFGDPVGQGRLGHSIDHVVDLSGCDRRGRGLAPGRLPRLPFSHRRLTHELRFIARVVEDELDAIAVALVRLDIEIEEAEQQHVGTGRGDHALARRHARPPHPAPHARGDVGSHANLAPAGHATGHATCHHAPHAGGHRPGTTATHSRWRTRSPGTTRTTRSPGHATGHPARTHPGDPSGRTRAHRSARARHAWHPATGTSTRSPHEPGHGSRELVGSPPVDRLFSHPLGVALTTQQSPPFAAPFFVFVTQHFRGGGVHRLFLGSSLGVERRNPRMHDIARIPVIVEPTGQRHREHPVEIIGGDQVGLFNHHVFQRIERRFDRHVPPLSRPGVGARQGPLPLDLEVGVGQGLLGPREGFKVQGLPQFFQLLLSLDHRQQHDRPLAPRLHRRVRQ